MLAPSVYDERATRERARRAMSSARCAVISYRFRPSLIRTSPQECIVTSLLDQKKDIKRQNILLERMRAESELEMATARAAARERVLKEFETAQSGLGSKSTEGKVSATGADKEGNPRGTKRAFELDEDEIERLTSEAIDEAANRMAKEMAEARKSKLTNYWLVSVLVDLSLKAKRLTSAPRSLLLPLPPSPTTSSRSSSKLCAKQRSRLILLGESVGFLLSVQRCLSSTNRFCNASLKTLTTLKFTEDSKDKTSTGEPVIICPCCRKTITNNVKTYGKPPSHQLILISEH